jgi:DNA topoisomerase I
LFFKSFVKTFFKSLLYSKMYKIHKGKSSYYVDKQKHKIQNKAQLNRIKELRIPPAWKQVVISKVPQSKVQAIGFDDKGRTQYIYSSKHKELSSSEKYKRVKLLGLNMHKIKKALKLELQKPGFTKNKVIALIIMIIIITSLRIGNEINLKLYKSYGLTTLLKKHIQISPNNVSIKFIGKKGVENYAVIKDTFIRNVINQWRTKFRPLQNTPFFTYISGNGTHYTITAPDVNKYIKKFGPYTAKDFRTYNANVKLLQELDNIPISNKFKDIKKTHIKTNIAQAMKQVAKYLNNTPAVCKKEYCSKNIVNKYIENPISFKKKIETMKNAKNLGNGNKYERSAIYFL